MRKQQILKFVVFFKLRSSHPLRIEQILKTNFPKYHNYVILQNGKMAILTFKKNIF